MKAVADETAIRIVSGRFHSKCRAEGCRALLIVVKKCLTDYLRLVGITHVSEIIFHLDGISPPAIAEADDDGIVRERPIHECELTCIDSVIGGDFLNEISFGKWPGGNLPVRASRIGRAAPGHPEKIRRSQNQWLKQTDCQTTGQYISNSHTSLFTVFSVNPLSMVAQMLEPAIASPNRAIPSSKMVQTRMNALCARRCFCKRSVLVARQQFQSSINLKDSTLDYIASRG